MKVSQLVAWILLATLAFFAVTLSVYSSYNVALLRRSMVELRDAEASNAALLTEIQGALDRMEKDLRASPSKPPADTE